LVFLNALFYDTAKHEELMYRNSLVVNGYSDKLEAAFSGPKAVRKDYLVDINGYGCGKLTLISL
jgi:hypothetical protein